jgi:hypothetical protein
MELFQRIERLGDMIKLANANEFKLFDPPKFDSSTQFQSQPSLTELANPKKTKTRVNNTSPNLKTFKGVAKPQFTAEMKSNSPYNER